MAKKTFQSGLPRPSHNFARIMFANLHRKTGGKLRIPSHRSQNDRFFELIILTPSKFIDNETVILLLESKNGGIFTSFRGHREELYSYIELRFLLRTSKMSDLKSNVINSLHHMIEWSSRPISRSHQLFVSLTLARERSFWEMQSALALSNRKLQRLTYHDGQ